MRSKPGSCPTLPAAVAAALACALVLAAAPARAGDNNTVYILQESPAASAVGNSLQIDQSGASNSLVIGPTEALVGALGAFPTSPTDTLATSLQPNLILVPLESARNELVPPMATQRGEGNTATLTIAGIGGEVQLLQDNSQVPFPQVGNQATVNAMGGALGAVIQIGDLNTATLNLGDFASGLISQSGTNLTANLTVGAAGSGQIVQIGNNNDTGPVVVPPGASLTYTQIGNDLAPVGATGVNIVSTTTSSNISITQIGF